MSKLKLMGWQTNNLKIEEREKVVIKIFSPFKPNLLFALYNLGYFLNSGKLDRNKNNFYFPSIKERIENEIKARKILQNLGLKTPTIFWYDEKSICMEKLDGENLSNFYKNEGLDSIKEVSKRIGEELKKVHENGFAFLDCRSENYMIKNNEIYRLDLEFFTKASEFKKMCDRITYISSILNLTPEKCKTAIKAFYEGYGNFVVSDAINTFLLSILYPFTLKENLKELTNRGFNLYLFMKGNNFYE